MTAYETFPAMEARVGLQSLNILAAMSAIDIEEATGIPRATAGRILRRETETPRDISGLTASVIRQLFKTESGIALKLQLIERDLRMAREGHLDTKVSFGLIVQATDMVEQIGENDTLHRDNLDTMANASARALLALYTAENSARPKARLAGYTKALRLLSEHFGLIARIYAMEDTTSDVDKLLGLRMLLNAFLAAWELDELEGNQHDLPRAKAVARLIGSTDVVQRARNIAGKIGDPRLSYQMSEATAVLGQHYTAAGLLGDAIRASGHDPLDPLGWAPPWLPTSILQEPHFAEPIRFLIEGKVKIKEFVS